MANKVFESAEIERPKYSAFDLSREQKLSCKMGELIPTYVDEVVPGDMFRTKSEILVRMAPMLAPVMHRVNVFMHYFFVPNRLVWNQWEDFITGGQDGDTFPTMPTITVDGSNEGNHGVGSLIDYFGLPVTQIDGGGTVDLTFNELPLRAYQLIWNEYFRDPNLDDELDTSTWPQADMLTLRNRAWEKDYFTSALPWTQRGEAAGLDVAVTEGYLEDSGDGVGVSTPPLTANDAGDLLWDFGAGTQNAILQGGQITINDLRRTSAIQRWLEKQARGGYRYIETILSHFGVESSDSRLQRPEYLGGGKQPIVISEVLNTSGTDTEPQGTMAGHGLSAGATNNFQQQFEEHGYVIGIMSVLPKTAYLQGIPRHFNRSDKYDYYWPEFANLGEQEVKNKEVYFDDTDNDYNEGTFGYQQRYAEYKYGCSSVHGDFRTSLDHWHLARKFQSQVQLNSDFVKSDPSERIFAETDTDHLWIQLYHDVKARRPMPYFADPTLL